MAHLRRIFKGGGTGVAARAGRARRPSLQVLGLLGLFILSGCRNDMHDQPRFKTYAMNTFYPDLRSERPPVEGTVARGQLNEDTYFYTGKLGANPGDYMPFPVTQDVLSHGRERFNIYCAPCHSRLGDGRGMVVQRGYRQPPSYHQDRLRKAPLGYFFDTMTNGFGAMPDYATQIAPYDRWCIVAYIRALQLSQNATQADVAGQPFPAPSPEFTEPGSGATLPTELPESEFTRGQMGTAGEEKK